MKTSEIIKAIDEVCPPELAEEWDNCGWQVNLGDDMAKGVLVTLEVTKAVIDEAVEKNCSLIVTHHPLIFGGLNSVDVNTVSGNHIIRLLREGISVYSCHTNFDKVGGGNNDYIGKLFGLENVSVLEDGFTRTGDLSSSVNAGELLELVCERLECSPESIRICGDPGKSIIKIGWCSGAGFDFAGSAKAAGCDAFITGDVKYHEAREISEEGGMVVIDAGHFGTEVSFRQNMSKILRERLGEGVRVIASESDEDPFLHLN